MQTIKFFGTESGSEISFEYSFFEQNELDAILAMLRQSLDFWLEDFISKVRSFDGMEFEEAQASFLRCNKNVRQFVLRQNVSIILPDLSEKSILELGDLAYTKFVKISCPSNAYFSEEWESRIVMVADLIQRCLSYARKEDYLFAKEPE